MISKTAGFFGLGAVVIVLLAGASVAWYKDIGFIQEKIKLIAPFSPRETPKLVTQILQPEQISKTLKTGQTRELVNLPSQVPPTTLQRLHEVNKSLVYQGDKNDTTGRTILVVAKGRENKADYSFCCSWAFGSRSTMTVGVFQAWQRIPGSKDLYAIVSDPDRDLSFIARINREKGSCSASDKYSDETTLVVWDTTNKYMHNAFTELGLLSLWSEQDLATIIHPGDILIILHHTAEGPARTAIGHTALRDHQGVACGSAIVVSRFDGKQQIEKELLYTLPPQQKTSMFDYLKSLDINIIHN